MSIPPSAAGLARDEDTMLTSPAVPGNGDPADERGTGRTVQAEWALWGKGPRDVEYSVLRCSDGVFGPGDFHGIITRYTPGAKETLPQYTVCWIPDENGHEGYLAVVIHELADPDPRRSGGRVRAAGGREIEYIRLFCVRYSEMAKNQVGYTELVESVMQYQLPAGSADSITVELLETEPPEFPAAAGKLAENVATLLLTTRPVCVLGADLVSAEDRLRFIDLVMSLLPYGLRATMSASTWASATARSLKLRLFFTSAERDDGGATTHVTWGRPQRFDLSGADDTPLRHYVNWLERSGAGAVGELAGQRDPVRFEPGELRQMIAGLPRDRPVKDVLEELADGLDRGQLPVIRAAVTRLRQRRGRPLSTDERGKYLQDIVRLRLFKGQPGLPARTADSVYRALLDLAYGPKLSYASYCDITDYAGGPPRGSLGREILKLKFTSYVPWLLAHKAVTELTDQELIQSLRDQGIAAGDPITEFRRHLGEVRAEHRVLAYDFAVRYLRACAADPRAELEQHGYLTETLAAVFPRDRRRQRTRLKEMMAFVYGGVLSEEAGAELLSRPGIRHTAAFEEAVEEMKARPRSGHTGGLQVLREYPKAVWGRATGAKVTVNAVAFVFFLMLIVGLVIFILLALVAQSLHV